MEMPVDVNRSIWAIAGARIAALALLGVVIIQCGGTTANHPQSAATTTGAHQAADACGLVTPQEVTTAFGSTAGAPHFVLNTCVYENADHELIVALARTDAKNQYDAGRASSSQPVSGLGDSAYIWNGRLAVLKGKSVMLITLVPGPTSGLSPAAMTLARAAVNRL